MPLAPVSLWRSLPSSPSTSLPSQPHHPLTAEPILSVSFLLYAPQSVDPLPVFQQLLNCSSHHPLLALETFLCLDGPTLPPLNLQASFPISSLPSSPPPHPRENATQAAENMTNDQQTDQQGPVNYHGQDWLNAFEEQRARTASIATSMLAELAATGPYSNSSSPGLVPEHRLHLLLPPTRLGASRAFNTMTALSTSQLVITLGPSQMPPSNCQCAWLRNFTDVFSAWPRLGAAGTGVGKVGLQNSEAAPLLGADRQSTDQFFNRMRCPVTGTRFSFVLSVVSGTMALRREAFVEAGGFDDVDGGMDELSEADLCRFLWLSGYQVGERVGCLSCTT